GAIAGQFGHSGSFWLAEEAPVIIFDTPASDMINGDVNGFSNIFSNGVSDIFAYTFTGPGSISGTLFHDTDGDGTQGGTETGLPFWTIYVDANGNHRFDAGEVNVQTDASGHYRFTNLAAGTYTIGTMFDDGFLRTLPAGTRGTYTVTLATDTSSVTDIDF